MDSRWEIATSIIMFVPYAGIPISIGLDIANLASNEDIEKTYHKMLDVYGKEFGQFYFEGGYIEETKDAAIIPFPQ